MTTLNELKLSPTQLEVCRQAFRELISEGLTHEAENQVIRALPAFFPPPARTTAVRTTATSMDAAPTAEIIGEALALDLGGTNARAAWLTCTPNGKIDFKKGPVSIDLFRSNRKLSKIDFFNHQAQLLQELGPPDGLPLGYCFSFPAHIEPTRDAMLLRWTKDIDVVDTLGIHVGAALQQALTHVGLQTTWVHVLNDTVASLLAGSFLKPPENPARTIGLIVGTGTNMAGYFSKQQAPKLRVFETNATRANAHNHEGRSDHHNHMAINLESGNLPFPYATDADRAVDQQSANPGQQIFEKAVSGFYLPQILGQFCPEFRSYEIQSSEVLVAYVNNTHDKVGQAARALLLRSADLVAAGLAAVIDLYQAQELVRIAAEGGLFWGDPLYALRVQQSLEQLLGPKIPFEIVRTENANLLAAGYAALCPNPWNPNAALASNF